MFVSFLAAGSVVTAQILGLPVSLMYEDRWHSLVTAARPTGGEPSTGLGLSIVKRLAEAMGGTVECSSRLGEGATFKVAPPPWREPPS